MRRYSVSVGSGARYKGLIGRQAVVPAGLPVIAPPAAFYEGDELVGLYLQAEPHTVAVAKRVMHAIKPSKSRRTAGVSQQAVVYGMLPRLKTRNDFCRISRDTVRAGDEVWQGAQLVARHIASHYAQHAPGVYAKHCEMSGRIREEWRISGTPFTTINWNTGQRIPYHRDTANQPGVFNNVLILRDGCSGGELILPEYGVALRQHDGDLVLFHGQRIVHGVAQFTTTKAGYRCAVVAYGLQNMEMCGSQADELRRARAGRSEIESVWRTDAAMAIYDKVRKDSDS